ncbi:hypothetical protein [Halostreptopolyspora alba]
MQPTPTTHRRRWPRSSRPATAGLAVALTVALMAGCSGDTDGSELPDDHHYIVQGNQLAHGDMRVGLMRVRDDEANIQVYAPDADDTKVVRVSEGDSVDVGRRTVTVERIDTDDERIAVTIEDPESTPPDNGSASEGASPRQGVDGDPMADPDVFAVRVGHRANESGLTIGVGSATDGTARILVSGDGVDEREVEVEAGDEVELGDRTLVTVEVGEGTAYFRIEDQAG